jgi:hypothetical protein
VANNSYFFAPAIWNSGQYSGNKARRCLPESKLRQATWQGRRKERGFDHNFFVVNRPECGTPVQNCAAA